MDEVIENTQKQIDKLQDLKKATMNELLTKGIGHTEFKDTELGRIPKRWEVVKLGDLSNVTKLAGFEYTEYFDYSSGEIIALRALNLDGGKLDLTNIKTIPKSVSDALPRSKLFCGDILISYVGSVGDLGFIYNDDRFHLAPNVAKISCDLGRVNAQFILKQLLSDRAQKNIEDLTTITSQPSLNMANIRKIRLLICDINEQEQIVKILSSLDMRIRLFRAKTFPNPIPQEVPHARPSNRQSPSDGELMASDELDKVELPALEQLQSLGWSYVEGAQLSPDESDERTSWKDVVLEKRLTESLKRINSWINDENLRQGGK